MTSMEVYLTEDEKFAHVCTYPDIYKPSQDTFLLLKYLPQLSVTDLVVEVGCGNGFLISSLNDVVTFASDINIQACKCTKQISNSQVVCADLLTYLRILPDVIIFNPPYVGGTVDEIHSDYDYAWNGLNEFGDAIIQKFLDQVAAKLTSRVTVYMIIEQTNRLTWMIDEFGQKYPHIRIETTELARQKVVNEVLSVIEFVLSKNVPDTQAVRTY